MKCRVCGEEFKLLPNHKGYANVCLNCDGNDVSPLMAKVMWDHKTAPEFEICGADEAIEFNKKNRRFGPGPLGSIIQTKNVTRADVESSKSGTGAEIMAQYRSSLGEARHVSPLRRKYK